MHNIKYNNIPETFADFMYFTLTNVANQKRARTKFSSLLPYHKFPHIWNALELRYRNIANKHKFKRELHANYLNTYLEHITCINLTCRQCYSF